MTAARIEEVLRARAPIPSRGDLVKVIEAIVQEALRGDEAIRAALLQLMGDVLDETSLPTGDSFVEMARDVIHVAIPGEDRYYRVTLTRVPASEYRT